VSFRRTIDESQTQKLFVDDLHKRYGDNEVLKGVSLKAKAGDVISIIGSSGSGKSTLLRCINFLEQPNAGRIVVDGEEVRTTPDKTGALRAADAKQLQRVRTKLAMVFQHFNLWSHMNVLENVMEAPVHVLGIPKKEAEDRAREYLEKVGLAPRVEAVSVASVRRPAAARRDRARARDASGRDAVRRADLGARSGTRRRSAEGDAEARRGRPHDDRRHARDGFRAQRVEPRDVPASGRVEEQGVPADVFASPKSERLRAFLSGSLK
jgi:histidine transport system ATP-binding protein